jgi:hypothetical protein
MAGQVRTLTQYRLAKEQLSRSRLPVGVEPTMRTLKTRKSTQVEAKGSEAAGVL